MIHLDTNFLIRVMVRGSPEDHCLRQWLGAGESLGISSIGWAEFLCGPVESRQVELAAQVVSRRVAFEEEDAARAARLFNESGRRRGSLTDCMIAATAIRAGARLATVNAKDFVRLAAAGLQTITV